MRHLRESMAERELQIELSEETKDFLVEKGWDPAMGARPLRRAIQRFIEDPLADEVLKTPMTPGSTVVVERDDEARQRAEAGDAEEFLKITILPPVERPAGREAGAGRRRRGAGARARAGRAGAAGRLRRVLELSLLPS